MSLTIETPIHFKRAKAGEGKSPSGLRQNSRPRHPIRFPAFPASWPSPSTLTG